LDADHVEEDATEVGEDAPLEADVVAVIAVERRPHDHVLAHVAEQLAKERGARLGLVRTGGVVGAQQPIGAQTVGRELRPAGAVQITREHLLLLAPAVRFVHRAPPRAVVRWTKRSAAPPDPAPWQTCRGWLPYEVAAASTITPGRRPSRVLRSRR